jgi:hypothetical protein
MHAEFHGKGEVRLPPRFRCMNTLMRRGFNTLQRGQGGSRALGRWTGRARRATGRLSRPLTQLRGSPQSSRSADHAGAGAQRLRRAGYHVCITCWSLPHER